MNMSREKFTASRRWVVKIGSALLTDDGKGLAREALASWVEQMAGWVLAGNELILVSSGAVAEGMSRMGWTSRPTTLHELQAAAAIGQMGLVRAYETCFEKHNLHTAQVLLTHDDLTNRRRYLNARSTLRTLLALGVVPVVNENDTVANQELRFGDNDTLAALVANLVEADLLVLLTDQDGLYDSDPRKNSDAVLIQESRVDDPMLDQVAGGSGGLLGQGGMVTKVRAARLAARSGTATIIAPGEGDRVLTRIAAGETLGTLLLPVQEAEAARKRWLAGHLQVRGRLVVDAGAVRVLKESGRSLLAVGVKQVVGNFSRGEMVACVDEQGREVARGLVNYNSIESDQIKGIASSRIQEILGYVDEAELIHRDNLVLV
ncbi:glutamate 5-kinase [Sedimenticola selenatireducens]|jgi:glutamate 5-kinase|uniref:Glutamate 5-kinase n=1 Tax=Sedimenticola selenatireducens TaxID=191960 RepID=A0A558DP48_9GAMM|nr:glutamate 5-kinase [Sedimenticola selenatireducens]TVO78340.1 glutamate 5-kinase [Sedimenticola selenatireducens]TVT62802.1 MAG: glutamate 5-kinase [Sedimenticola selenatireducens]